MNPREADHRDQKLAPGGAVTKIAITVAKTVYLLVR